MSDELSYYTISILGTMNPRIHHPSWYRLNKLIDSDAESFAVSQDEDDFVSSPAISQFSTRDYAISCVQEKWQIVTEERKNIAVIQQVALKTFDDLLAQTPISGYEFWFRQHRITRCADVESYFVKIFNSLPFGLEPMGKGMAGFVSRADFDQRNVGLRCEPSTRSKNMVYVAMSASYSLTTSETPRHFELSPVLQEQLRCELEQFDRISGRIADSISSNMEEPILGDA